MTDTPEEALRCIRRVIAEVVADLQANGEAVPDALKPSLDDFVQAQRYLRVAA